MSNPRTIFLTDIHGCNTTLKVLLEQLNPQADDTFCFLGDYIDRGPDSKGVIDSIWELEKHVKEVICLLGNHEEMLLLSLDGELQALSSWLTHGGQETLTSFGVDSAFGIPERYIHFVKSCIAYAEIDGAILVHAGLDFLHYSRDPFYDERMMRWIRKWYSAIDYKWLGNRTIIHGHTPTPLEKVKSMVEDLGSSRCLNLDTGCVYKHPGLGFLSAYDWTNKKLISTPRVEP